MHGGCGLHQTSRALSPFTTAFPFISRHYKLIPRQSNLHRALHSTFTRQILRKAKPSVTHPSSGPSLATGARLHCFPEIRILGRRNVFCTSSRRERVSRAQRLCMQCDQHVLGDERHLVHECPAVQKIRDKYPALFGADIRTMQQFMCQLDIVGVAHSILDCFDYLNAVSTSNQP